MKIQSIEQFFADGTVGAIGGKSLADAVARMNKKGWTVDQVIPLTFRPLKYSVGSMDGNLDVTSGVLLCSKTVDHHNIV